MRLLVDVFGIAAPHKVDHDVVTRVAYVEPGALAELSRRLHPDLESDGNLAGQARRG